MIFVRPRINDVYNIPITQEAVSFAIPFVDEDIPLYLDPFLLWKSPSQQDNALHTSIVNSFNNIGYLANEGKEKEACILLQNLSECSEVGLGTSKSRLGQKIGYNTANDIISLFKMIPQINKCGFVHFEEIQLFVDNIAKDRISDFACSFIKSFLIDYTIDECRKIGIPLCCKDIEIYDYRKNKIIKESVQLPINPENKKPIIFVPKRWLRFSPWINYEDYFQNCFIKSIDGVESIDKPQVLNYNRKNYDLVQTYLAAIERVQEDCKNDPLFKQIPIMSAERLLSDIIKIETGKSDNADKKYEHNITKLLASLLYPHLDFAQDQSRTINGVNIRDLIFYNNRDYPFLDQVFKEFECRQIIFELKNVKQVDNDNIDQLNRYLSNQFGRFGIIVSRYPILRKVYKNTIDLWSGQRKCILCLNDQDIIMMVDLFETKQRNPIDVINKKFVEFARDCPS